MPRMSRMKDLSAQHPARVKGHLAIQAAHSAHLQVSPKGLVVSPVVVRLVVSPVEAGASTVVAAVDNEIGAKSSAKSKRGSHGPLFLSLPPPMILTCGIIV